MVIEQQNNIELVGGEGTKMQINAEGLESFVMQTIRSYSNPLIFILEAISNGHDASIHNMEKITCGLYNESNVLYLKVKDKGTGMSPKAFKEHFMAVGNSTKQTDKNAIGHFSIGGKAPLAYTDEFTVITIHDKIKYYYEIFIDGNGFASFTLINKEDTKEENGTTIIVEIEFSDKDRIIQFLKKRCIFFKRLVFDGLLKELNDIEIKKGNTYYERVVISKSNSSYYYNTDCYGTGMLIGEVPYEIKWDELEMDPIKIPALITIPVNSPVNPMMTREDITWTKKAKEYIKSKLNDFVKEISKEWEDKVNLNKNNLEFFINNYDKTGYIKIQNRDFQIHNSLTPSYKDFDLEDITLSYLLSGFKVTHNYDNGHISTGDYRMQWPYSKNTYTVKRRNPKKDSYMLSKMEKINLIRPRDFKTGYYRQTQIKKAERFRDHVLSLYPKYEDIIIPDSFNTAKKKKTFEGIMVYKVRSGHNYPYKPVLEKTNWKKLSQRKRIYYSSNKEMVKNLFSLIKNHKNVIVIHVSNKLYKEFQELNTKNLICIDTIKHDKIIYRYLTSLLLNDDRNRIEYVMENIYVKTLFPNYYKKFLSLKQFKNNHKVNSTEFTRSLCFTALMQNYYDKSKLKEMNQLKEFYEKKKYIRVLFNTYDSVANMNKVIKYQKLVDNTVRMKLSYYQHSNS